MKSIMMNIDEELQSCITQLSFSQKKSILDLIRSFAISEETKPMSIEQYNQELKEAEAEYKSGEIISHEAMINAIKKW